jgi:archaellum component FlaC
MPQRFTYNARTGELRGITTLKIGDPQVTVEEFVTSYISSNKSEVYDSDLVVATVLKNLDIAALTSGGGGAGVTDSDLAVVAKLRSDADSDSIAIQALSEYIDSQIQIVNNQFDSEYARVNNRFDSVDATIATVQNRVDSESAKVSTLKTDFVAFRIESRDNDSDHARDIQRLKQESDSDGGSLLGIKRFVRGENSSPNNIFEYYRATGAFGSNPFHDSDLVIASAQKGINTTATFDSDRVVQTIIKAGEIALKDDFVDSDEVFNMGGEHGWFYDSDRVMDTVDKNFVTIINFVNNNLGKVDSEFVLTMVDSEEVVNMFREHNLVTKDLLDSETARIQLLLSNADSDQIAIAELRRDADSDTIVIQALKTQADIDSAYITLIRNDLDSDSSGIQAIRTDMDSESARINARLSSIDSSVSSVQSTQTVQNGRLATLEARSDSDETKLQSIQEQVNQLRLEQDSDSANSGGSGGGVGTGMTDSDLKVVADLRNDLDSDFGNFNTRIKSNFDSIQTLNSTTNSQGGRITLLEARVDSESAKVQTINGTVATLQATQNAYGGRITSLESRADSDELVLQSLQAQITTLSGGALGDSDLKVMADLRNDLDSDFTAINALQANVTTIESRLDSDEIAISARLPLAGGTMSGDIDGNGNKVLFANVYSNLVDLPNASTYHGMFAHVHATGAAYFAHGGNWIRLASYSDLTNDSDLSVVATLRNDVDSDSAAIQALSTRIDSVMTSLDSETARIQLLLASTDSDALNLAETRRDAESDAAAIVIIKQNAESDSAAIQALQSTLGPRLDSDELKIQALDTELSSLETSLTARLDSDETAIQSVRTDMDVSFDVANNGASAYTFTGDGFPSGVDNPTIYLHRGHTYNFRVNASGHPFQIRLSSGGSAYSSGVTNNGAQVGLVKFVVPMDAPESLVYQCTLHSGMVGTIRIGKQGFDSDQIASMISENSTGTGMTDSDLAVVAKLRNDVDSDSVKLQALQEAVNQLRIEQDSDSTHSSGSGGGGAAGFDSDQIVAIINENPTSSGTGMTDSDLKVVADLRNDITSLQTSGVVTQESTFTTFKYKANNSQTTFSGADRNTNSLSYTPGNINVYVNGVLINDSDDYTATNGTSVVLNLAADSDDVVVIQKMRSTFDSDTVAAIFNDNLTDLTITRFDYTATQGQTAFSGSDDNGNTLSYAVDKIQVFLNGILMMDTTDYTATNGTLVTLVSAADSDDKLSVLKYFGKDVTKELEISRFTFKYTPDGGSTVGDSEISGRDTHNNLLAYTAGKIQVYSNGILLEDSDDYIATDGSTITLLSAPDSDDVVTIFKYLGVTQSGFDSDQVVAIVNENSSAGFDSDQVVAIINENSSGGSLAGWTAPTDSEYQLVAGQQVILDTSAWPRSVILPSSATLGDEVRVLDGVGMAATYPITVSRNGHRIMGDSDDMTVNTDNAGFALVYYNATYGWRLKEN